MSDHEQKGANMRHAGDAYCQCTGSRTKYTQHRSTSGFVWPIYRVGQKSKLLYCETYFIG